MKNILMIGLVGGVVFGASAGASFVLNGKKHKAGHDAEHGAAEADESPNPADDHHEADAHGAKPAADAGHGASGGDSGHGAAAAGHGSGATATAHEPAAGSHGAEGKGQPQASAADRLRPLDNALPGSIRPRPVSVEELLRYSLGLKSREEALSGRERDIERRQSQVNIALTDIQGEQHELDGLRRQVKDQISAVDGLLAKLADERLKFAAEKAKAEEEMKKYDTVKKDNDASQRENVKTMSTWFQGIEPEKAAGLLKSFANEGKMDLAVELLANFEDREASKVLGAIDDPSLTVELAEAFQKYKRAPKKTDAKR